VYYCELCYNVQHPVFVHLPGAQMPALFIGTSAAPAAAVSCEVVEVNDICADGTSRLCEVRGFRASVILGLLPSISYLFRVAAPVSPNFLICMCYLYLQVLVAGQVLSGVYEPARRHLIIPCDVSSKLSDHPQDVSALVCSCDSNLGTGGFLVLLTAEDGATLVIPR
jgi:hypothetical protein